MRYEVQVEKIPGTETADGNPRWDVSIDGEWDSSWELKADAVARASTLRAEREAV